MKTIYSILLFFIMSVFLVASCSEDAGFSVSPLLRLEFSRDTIAFDTVFTAVGSPTSGLVVRNRNKDGLRISNVRLASGGESGFSVLVDGQYGPSMNGLEVRGKDSIYVFASVELERNGADVPIVVEDSLIFTLESGVQQHVSLLAYGRDVTFMRGEVVAVDRAISGGHHVVYDSLVVEQDVTLTLGAGTTLYFHDKAYMKVGGTLVVEGTQERPVVMRGDRTDNMFSYLPYDRVPGQWGGVTYTSTSNGNILSHCDIHSAKYGVKVEPGDTTVMRIAIESSKLYNFEGNALELNMSRAIVDNSLINTKPTEDSCFVNISYDNTPYGKEHFRTIDHDNFYYDFHLSSDTMAYSRGSDEYLESLPYDLDGVLRQAGAVDAGCYQFVELPEEEE